MPQIPEQKLTEEQNYTLAELVEACIELVRDDKKVCVPAGKTCGSSVYKGDI